MNTNTELRIRLRRGDPMCGPFIKTPHYQNIEIAGAAGMDFVVLDAEHAPFSVEAIDRCLLGCAAASLPGLVRLPDAEPSTILQVLDMGAAGIVVPHVVSATQARAAVAATRYRDGVRGFSNSPRAGGYGRLAMAEHLSLHDAAVSVVCQIEDPEAVDHVDEIAAVSGVDCLFIGRADLAVSYQANSLDDERIERAIDRTIQAGRAAGVTVGMFLPDAGAARRYADRGMRFFILGSDQSLLSSGLTQIARTFHAA